MPGSQASPENANVPDNPAQRFRHCARVAVLVAMAPLLAYVALNVILPLVYIGFGCDLDSILVRCTSGATVRRLQEFGGHLPMASFISTPLAIVLFYTCRYFRRRATQDPSSGSK